MLLGDVSKLLQHNLNRRLEWDEGTILTLNTDSGGRLLLSSYASSKRIIHLNKHLFHSVSTQTEHYHPQEGGFITGLCIRPH